MRTCFGPFTLDPDTRQLFDEGGEVRLTPKAFDLLVLLVQERPKVLHKRDLLARIWPNTHVVEANLNVLVGELRRALGDQSKEPRYIRTVHATGFAFAADASAMEAPSPARERAYLEAAATRCPEYKGDAYAAAMKHLAEQYPDDLDAATLYAESLMVPVRWRWYASDGTPAAGTPEAEQALMGRPATMATYPVESSRRLFPSRNRRYHGCGPRLPQSLKFQKCRAYWWNIRAGNGVGSFRRAKAILLTGRRNQPSFATTISRFTFCAWKACRKAS